MYKQKIVLQSLLVKPLPVQESRFSSWSIDFTTDLPLSHRCNTILTYVDYLMKYIILIPCKIYDKTLISAAVAQSFGNSWL